MENKAIDISSHGRQMPTTQQLQQIRDEIAEVSTLVLGLHHRCHVCMTCGRDAWLLVTKAPSTNPPLDTVCSLCLQPTGACFCQPTKEMQMVREYTEALWSELKKQHNPRGV